jgi:hypothetical protein
MRKARVEGADDGKAIGRRATQQDEWGGGHDAGQLGSGLHDRGGGRTTHARWWLTAFWQRREGVHSRRPQNHTSKLHLKLCKKTLRKSGFPRRFLLNLRYNLMYNKSYLKSYQFFCVTERALEGTIAYSALSLAPFVHSGRFPALCEWVRAKVCLGASVSLFFICLASGRALCVSLFGFGFGFRPVRLLGRASLGKFSHLPERYSSKYSNYVGPR